jgi:hypothetical protein
MYENLTEELGTVLGLGGLLTPFFVPYAQS